MFYAVELIASADTPSIFRPAAPQADAAGYEDSDEMLRDFTSDGTPVVEIGVDELPAGFEDIRARIEGAVTRVFGFQIDQDEPVYYFAIIDR